MTFVIPATDHSVVITSIIFTSIALIIMCSRLYTRIVLLQNAGADDYFMTAAMVASIGFCSVVFLQIKYGLGTPFKTVPQDRVQKFFQCLWATIPTYNLSLTLTKVSIVFQYMRIFTTPRISRFCKIMVGVLVLYGLWTVLGSIFMCIPVSAFWNMKGKCMNKLAFWFSNAALNIATDILIFCIPMPLLKQLQLPKRQKIGLVFVFGFGAFVCVTSIIRLKSLYEISISPDTTLDGVSTAIWSGIEINVAISCASLPTLKPLISRVLPGFLSSIGGSRNRSNMNNLSGNDLESGHNLSALGNNKSKNGSKLGDEIRVEQTVYQAREVRASLEGSERSLVNWQADCFSEEQKKKKHDIV